jgi:hypothetical protein
MGGASIAPVISATASDMEYFFGSMTVSRLPRRWMWMRLATGWSGGRCQVGPVGADCHRISQMASACILWLRAPEGLRDYKGLGSTKRRSTFSVMRETLLS